MFTSPDQDRNHTKGLIISRMLVLMNLLKCDYMKEWCPRELWKEILKLPMIYSVQFSSFTQSCLTLCEPILQHADFPVHHQLLELAQIHVYQVSDAIQPSHPLLSPYPPAFNLSQHEGLSNESVLHIRWQSIGVSPTASVLPMNIQDWFSLGWTGWISLQSKGLSRVFSNTTVQKHQFFCTQLSL